ncbi:MAG: hypothetical protein ACI9MC_003589 [Kiritimatiellia bacterium]|jgi:hypothetical protein
MKSNTQRDQRSRPATPQIEREERLQAAAKQVVEHAKADAASYLRESKVPGGGE